MDECIAKVPTRLSIKQTDKGYQPHEICRMYTIKLNGIALNNCITADVDKGYVVRQVIKRNAAGKNVGGSYVCKGKVEIIGPAR